MGSAADAPSYEASRYGEGLLTYALLEGMRGASLDDGSRLGVSRWFEDASEEVPLLAESIGGIQKPIIAAPKGRGFPVGLLTIEDRANIPLELPKPELLRVTCEDDDGLDPIHLRSALREQMRALDYAEARGTVGADVPIVYLDSVDDEVPGAIAPKVRYTVSNGSVTAQIRLVLDDKLLAAGTVTGSNSNVDALATLITDRIVSMATAK